jgi:hypothetical protein
VREGYSARLAKLDFELRSGSVISVDVVRVNAFNLARRCRPNRASSRINPHEE